MALRLQGIANRVSIRKESFVRLRSLLLPLCAAAAVYAQTKPVAAPGKVAIIQFQAAVLSTQEGQQAQAALKSKFDPRKNQLEKRQADLQAIDEKLKKGGATLGADVKGKLEKDLAAGTRLLNNEAEDLNSDVQEEEGKVMQSMASRMGDVIKDYAAKNGYGVVIDVSSQQSSVLWASPSVNITEAIVKLYDQANPVKAGTPPAAPPKPPASKKQ
jgi:outer membrane protein